MTKVCTGCNLARPIADFASMRWGKHGVANRCRPCKSAYDRALYEAKRERIRKQQAEYRLSPEYRAAYLDAKRAQSSARRAKLTSAGQFSAKDWRQMCRVYGHRCAYCGATATLTADHVIPLARGGSNNIGNIVPACGKCNSSKRDRLLVEWKAILAKRSPVWFNRELH